MDACEPSVRQHAARARCYRWVLRGSGVHDAGGGGACARAPIVVVHPEVVPELMSHDGGERWDVVVGELREEEWSSFFFFVFIIIVYICQVQQVSSVPR